MADDASAHPDVLNQAAQGQLKSIIERIERLEIEKAEVAEQIKEVFAEAKGNGFDVKILRKVVRIRKQDRAKRMEEGRHPRPLSRGDRGDLNRKPPDLKAQAKRAALNALKRAQRQADRAGVKLSEWEGEFLGSVTDRLKDLRPRLRRSRKGRARPGAFGPANRLKLKEITAKAKGEKKELKRKPFRRKSDK